MERADRARVGKHAAQVREPATSAGLGQGFHDSPSMQAQRQHLRAAFGPGVLGPLQRVKGDLDDPFRVPEGKYDLLPRATDKVLVPGVSGCAAVKINTFATIDNEERLISSFVLHSDGLEKSMNSARQIADQIIYTEAPQRRVDVLVLFNRQRQQAESHAKVLGEPLCDQLRKAHIEVKMDIKILQRLPDVADLDVTGTREEILERYAEQLNNLPKTRQQEEVAEYRRARAQRFRQAVLASGVTQQKLQSALSAYGQAESRSEVDDLLARYENMPRGGGAKKKSGRRCYLTTACVQHRGLRDDCEELLMLRAFRDGWMQTRADTAALVPEYYRVAPALLAAIRQRPDAEVFYEAIFQTVRGCVAHIQRGDMEGTLALYVGMVQRLQAALIPAPPPARTPADTTAPTSRPRRCEASSH